MKKLKRNEQFKLPRPKFDKNGLASAKLSDRIMGRSQYYAGIGWVKPHDGIKVLHRGVQFKRPKFKHNWQVKHRFINWISRPRFPLSWFGNKRFVLGIVIIASLIGTTIIYQGPAFHGKVPNPAYNDPTTFLWGGQPVVPGNLQSWKTAHASVNTITNGINLTSTSTDSALALSQTPIPDLSVVQAKELLFLEEWLLSGVNVAGCCNGIVFGMYLTQNGTLPSPVGYNPNNDKSVFLTLQVLGQSGTATFQEQLLFLLNAGNETINQESFGCGNGARIFCTGNFNIVNSVGSQAYSTFMLNYTGSAATGGNNGLSWLCAGITAGTPACPSVDTIPTNAATANTINYLPRFQVTNKYYIGFFMLANNLNVPVTFVFTGNPPGPTGWGTISYFVPIAATPTPPSPTLDSGGFFGPIIKALIALGVFILQTLISFFTFIVGVVKLALDTIGGFVGLGAIGTALFTILSAAGNFISSVITTIGTQLANIVGFITSAASAIVAFLNSGGSFIWTQVTNFFNLWAVLFPLFNTIFLVFTAFSQNGVQLAQYGLIAWWLYGIFVVLEQGTEKWWNHWVDMGENVFKKVFNLGYWMIELSFHWLVWLKNLLAQWV